MSYSVLASIVSVIYGFAGMLFIVYANAGTKRPVRVLWATSIFFTLLTILALLTTGWGSAFSSIVGGALMFLIEAGTLGIILATYGEVFQQIADHDNVYLTRFAPPLEAAARALQRTKPALANQSPIGWCVRNAIERYDSLRNRNR